VVREAGESWFREPYRWPGPRLRLPYKEVMRNEPVWDMRDVW